MNAEQWQPPPVLLAVDLLILTLRDSRLQALLVERGVDPFIGRMALPGGFLRDAGEGLGAAAERELREEAGLDAGALHLEQLGVYGEPDRDPRGRVVSVAYLAITPRLPDPIAGSDAAEARWCSVDEIARGDIPLAFDHADILADGVDRARSKIESTALATAFCGDEFTIPELQQVYEAVWGAPVDPRNFYRKVKAAAGLLAPADTSPRKPETGRPARLYRAGPATVIHPPILRSVALA
ncbi:NUDIX hydrolase [Cryptosporangium arvum]|uniref:ADP-ribose pyrophosphatase n=1 Tax=Cryptosporangium arvum DSM 44712 TaxID=927661 RepID=A0A011A0B0_9ACTN|nr:NUDIX domain-containing protein [Cryptosporangium arvum]EXG82927.1 ADP-ribose pyrophosphatase [Cryptosporangium arvum DSM 44712]